MILGIPMSVMWNLVTNLFQCFGGESKPKHKDRVPTFEPHNQPVLLKAGDDIHDPWNIREQLHCFHNLQQPTLQSSSSSFVDTRNAL